MTRQNRQYSKSEVYHVMLKGVDGQDIFYNDFDKKVFLRNLLETKKKLGYKIYAYCLMSNHIHLIVGAKDKVLSKAMQGIGVRYSLYFNNKYLRSGPLFQNRFNSKCVENQKYFLDVCRYVHQNPEKAGICRTQDYKWSSYHEYVGKEFLIDKNVLLHYLNNDIKHFERFTLKEDSYNKFDFIEYELRNKFDDNELAGYLIKTLNLNSISDFSKMSKEELEKSIEFFKELKYTNLSQIARVTRINRWILEKLIKD